jgi:hypothetical protein
LLVVLAHLLLHRPELFLLPVEEVVTQVRQMAQTVDQVVAVATVLVLVEQVIHLQQVLVRAIMAAQQEISPELVYPVVVVVALLVQEPMVFKSLPETVVLELQTPYPVLQ